MNDDDYKETISASFSLEEDGISLEAFDAAAPYVEAQKEPQKHKYYCAIMNFAILEHDFSLQERANIFVRYSGLEHFGQYKPRKDIKDNGISAENFVAIIGDYVRNNEMARLSISSCDTYERFALFEMMISEDGREVKELLKDFPESKFTFFAFPDEQSRDNNVNYLCGNYQEIKDANAVIESLHLDS